MPELRFSITGPPRGKKNSQMANHRPAAPFVKWEDSAIIQLRRVRQAQGLTAPIDMPCTLDAVFYVRDHEADVTNYLSALCDVLDATRAKFAHRKKERQLKVSLPFQCDYQVVTDDKLFNKGVAGRVLRDKDNPRVEVRITWQ